MAAWLSNVAHRDVEGESVLYLGRGLFVLGVDVQHISIQFVKPHAGKQPIKNVAPPTMSAMRAAIA